MTTILLHNREQESWRQRTLILFTYVILLFSLPVSTFWRALLPVEPFKLVWVQLGILATLLLLTRLWKPVHPLRGFVLIALLINMISDGLTPLVRDSAVWISWFSTENPSFWQALSGVYSLKLAATSIVIAVLLLMGLQRRDFFLVKGQLDAPAAPVRWLGMKASKPWTVFGRNFAILTFVGIFSAVVLPNLPRWGIGSVVMALPLLPAALLFAAINSIYEEIVFRAAILPQLVNVVGVGHALAVTILWFGLAHLIGSEPSGVVGVLVAAFFGFIMGKAMLETRGMTWPWICHFAADAAVFIFIAISMTAEMM